MIYRILAIIIITNLLALYLAFPQNDKKAEYNKLVEKYSGLKSLSTKFSIDGNYRVTGSIRAKKGNKYLLDLGNRIVVSNGKTLWNYSKRSNNVVISKFDESNMDFSIEQFFFNYLLAYIPTELKSESKSKGDFYYILRIEPENKEKMLLGVNYIDIKYDPKNYNIIGLNIAEGNQIQYWRLEDFKINPVLNDSLFEFTPPKDAEIIDMR